MKREEEALIGLIGFIMVLFVLWYTGLLDALLTAYKENFTPKKG